MCDVRELIPEFFYLPQFLVNKNKLDFGRKQNGKKIDDVELPRWWKPQGILLITFKYYAESLDIIILIIIINGVQNNFI